MATNTLWITELDASPATDFRLAGDLILIVTQAPGAGTDPACLYAFSRLDGSLQWKKVFDNFLIAGMEFAATGPAAGSLFVAASSREFLVEDGTVWALDQAGQERWRWHGDVQTISALTLSDDMLSFTADSELFIQLEAASGVEQLHVELEALASFSAPCWHNDRAYIPGRGAHIMAVDASGHQQWHHQAEGSAWLDKTPVIAGEHLLAVNGKRSILALDLADGRQLWQTEVGAAGRLLSSPVTDGQRVVMGARRGLVAIDAVTGQTVWSFATERDVTAQAVICGQTVYATCHDHYLYALDVTDGQELWRQSLKRRIELPALIDPDNDGLLTIYAVDRGGQIVAVQDLLASSTVSSVPEEPVVHEYAAESIHQLEVDGEVTQAAEAWYEAGNLERAAEQFEVAEKWERAAALWQELGRFLKHAQALEGHAHCVEDDGGSDEQLAQAWGAAAAAYEADGEKIKAKYCRLQVARYEQQPVLDLTIEYEGLALNVWSKLQLTVNNTGFGPARRVDIHASGEQFVGQVSATKQLFKLLPGNQNIVTITVRPLQYGDSVPLTINLDYLDNKVQVQRMKKTVFVPVARERASRVVGQVEDVFAQTGGLGKVARTLTNASDVILAELRRNLAIYFSVNELRDLCFEMGIDAEELITQRKSDFAREIILYLQRRGRMTELLAYCARLRPHIDW